MGCPVNQETPVEMARRHVAEAETRIARQELLITKMTDKGLDTGQAEAILCTFETTLRLMREDLEVLEARSGSLKWARKG